MIHVLGGIDATSAALTAERIRIDVIGQNIANAQGTRDADGNSKPYQRQQVVFESALQAARDSLPGAQGALSSVRVARIESDQRPPRMIYNPNHPDADPASGMVAMPNVNIHEEMVDMIAASRSFEANLSVVRTARSMAMQTLGIGKR
ncbi:MAG: flagellar basal body rod protein FlgC [Verrucomicrobiales bacterium]|nr:flagellar basal body rod protein FlgC [Verrucomicrobiales bacterium]